jgi:hypothetical protein
MSGNGLREGLLAAEGVTPELERRYRERLRSLAEQRLTAIQRGSHVFGLVLGLALTVRFVQLFIAHGPGGRPVEIVALAVGFAFSVGWVFASASVLVSGVDRFFTHGAARTQLIVVFTFLLAGLMVWAGLERPDAAQGVRFMLYGLVFWCAIGLPFLVAYLVRWAELRVRAEVLGLELSLAERDARRGQQP